MKWLLIVLVVAALSAIGLCAYHCGTLKAHAQHVKYHDANLATHYQAIRHLYHLNDMQQKQINELVDRVSRLEEEKK